MRHLFFVLLSLCFILPAFGQNNIKKNASIAYTLGPPTYTVNLSTSSEIAIDTSTGRIYQYHRSTGTWLQLGQGIDVISGGVPPAYTPLRNQSLFAINAVDSLYTYRSGAWRHLNPGGGGAGDDWGAQYVITDSSTLGGAGTSGDPLYWTGASVAGPLTGSGTSLSPLNILSSSISTTHTDSSIDNHLLPSGANKYTLRHNGTTWIANNLLRNDGTGIGINADPKSGYLLNILQTGTTDGIRIESSSDTNATIKIYDGGGNAVFHATSHNIYMKTGQSFVLEPPGGGSFNYGMLFQPAANVTRHVGDGAAMRIAENYAPTASGGDESGLIIEPIVNQTGAADQPVYWLRLGGTIISAIDPVGIYWNQSSGTFLRQSSGTSVKNHLIGNLGIGTGTTSPAAKLQLLGNGATSGTYSLIVTNSGGTTSTAALVVRDDSRVGIGTNAPAEALSVAGNVQMTTAGNKLKIATGPNASMGTATLVGGTVTVSTTAVSSSSTIFLTCDTPGGTQGFLSRGTIVNATSFVINSSSGTDTSTVNWIIIN